MATEIPTLDDAAEDHGREQLAAILDQFGSAVAKIVAGCTEADGSPKPPRPARKETYVRHFQDASPSAPSFSQQQAAQRPAIL